MWCLCAFFETVVNITKPVFCLIYIKTAENQQSNIKQPINPILPIRPIKPFVPYVKKLLVAVSIVQRITKNIIATKNNLFLYPPNPHHFPKILKKISPFMSDLL